MMPMQNGTLQSECDNKESVGALRAGKEIHAEHGSFTLKFSGIYAEIAGAKSPE